MSLRTLVLTALLLTGAVAFLGCEWSGGSDGSFNTSKGAGAEINISGIYNGVVGGGKAVANTSNGNITSLTLTQAGNRVDVIDNQGSRYQGTVGSPVLSSLPDGTNVIPPGWLAAQYQVTWTGKDGVAQQDIQFTGVIDVVTVENVQGSTTTTSNDQSQDSTTDSSTSDDQSSSISLPPSDTISSSRDTSSSESTSDSSSNSSTIGTTSTTSFSLTEANTQFRLRGSWVEQGGGASQVSAISPGNAGNLTTTDG